MRAASAAEGKDRVVTFALRWHQIVLDIATEFVKLSLRAQIKPNAAGRIHLLESRLAKFVTMKRFEIKVGDQHVYHFLAIVRIQMNEIIIC